VTFIVLYCKHSVRILKKLTLFFALSFWIWNSFSSYGQKSEWLTFDDSIKTKSDFNWSLSGYYGWNSSFFSTQDKSKKFYSSRSNLGLDLKMQVRKNLFLCLINRFRFDNYYIDVPEFENTQTKFLQEYLIHNHAFALEHRVRFKNFNVFYGGGFGLNFIYPSGIGLGFSVNGVEAIKSFSTDFLNIGSGINYFILSNLGFEVMLFENLSAFNNISISYDFIKFNPIVPIEVVSTDGKFYISPIPRKWNVTFQVGLSLKF